MRVAIVDTSAIDRRITERLVDRAPELTLAWASDELPDAETARGLGAVILDPSGPSGLDSAALARAAALPDGVAIVLFTRFVARAEAWVRSLDPGRRASVVDKDARGNSQVTAFTGTILPWILEGEPRSAGLVHELPTPMGQAKPAPAELHRRPSGVQNIVVIGASTGGPAAIGDLLRALPADLDASICITQHMPDGFTRRFAERLDATTHFDVAEATEGAPLSNGRVLIAPSGRHFELANGANGVIATLTDAPPENWCRPAVDRLFQSAALLHGPRVVAVVLTGMGRDGESGAAALRDAGARIYVQDEASSVVWGMPGAVARAGYADAIDDIPTLAALLDQEFGRIARGQRRRTS